jgi:hypothetical protein
MNNKFERNVFPWTDYFIRETVRKLEIYDYDRAGYPYKHKVQGEKLKKEFYRRKRVNIYHRFDTIKQRAIESKCVCRIC